MLKYFWEVESFGLSNFTGNLVFNYLDADIVGGPESSYISARLLTPGTSWSKLTTVDPVLNTFTFNYTGTDNVNGEYTAGLDPAFPADVPEYTSIADGIWTDETNWVQTGGSTIYPCPVGGPNGFIVNINHIITANADYCQAYRTVINSELKIVSPYTGHNLGTVTGNGTLLLESATFPAGRYTSFLDCSGNGTIEYGGNSSYTIIADLYSSVPRLYFTGTGTKTLPNKDLTICKRLLIDGVMLDNTLNNSKLTIQGTMERINSGIFASGSGANATVSFSGSTAQTVGGATLGNFTGTSAFNNLEINNSAGLTINNPGSIEVKGNLLLTSGLINTSSTATLTITNTAIGCVTPAGGSATSYVNGPLTKRINQGDNFFYPLGKGATAGNMLTLSSTQVGTILWTAEYFTPNSTYTNLTAPLSYVNSKDFWTVSAPSGSQAIVNLKWNPTSDLTPLMTQNGLSDMRVAYYNSVTPSWEEVASSASGDDNNGTVSTTSRVTIPATGSSNYTVACINVTKPKARLNPTGAVCGIAGIPISFSGVNATNLNFIINYKKGGIAQAPVTVNSLPYSLPTDATGTTYQLTSFTYNNPPHSAPVETGVVDASIITTYTVPTTANAGPDQSLCGASSATLAGNLPVIGTGLWSYSGAGGSFDDPTDRNTVFHGTNGTAYVLQWTITNGGCTSFADVNITFPLLAVQPAGFSASTTPVCQGTSGVVYTVPNDPLVTYVWSYSGTNANIIGSLNSITVDYLGNATSGDLSVRAHNGCGDSAPLTLSITVKVSPTATLSVDGGFNLLCDGDNTQITVTITGGTSPYDFDIYNGAATENFTNIVSPYTFIPSVANFPVWTGPTASNTYTYSVPTVTSANGCSNAGSNTVDVVVNKRPETGPQYHIPNSMGL
ncbi:MAG TPA: hypothetical protein DIW31_02335 [Bacteroidales bacterium]|nr:hypothetical protein [Bacteroidales bacterium]